MSKHMLMEKPGAGQMNVPPDKVQQYLEDGWIIVIQTAAPILPIVMETTQEESEPEPEQSSSKSRKAKK